MHEGFGAASGAEDRTELTDDDTGVFLVTTVNSVYRIDLDGNTAERVGGEPRPPAAPADTLQPLRSLIEIRVGRPARWWIRNMSGGFTDPSEIWQHTSVVLSIVREDVADRPIKNLANPLSE